MQTISINFIVPQGWHELSDKQLRYVYQLLAQNFTSDEVKTLCLLHWTGTKVIGKQNTDGYLLRKGRFLFEVTPLTLAELLPNLDWLGSLPTSPIRPVKLKHRPGIAADFDEVPFEQYIIVDNLYQGYLQTQDDTLLDEIASVVYPGIKTPLAPDERIAIFYWVASLKSSLASRYPDFFQPADTVATGNLLGSPSLSVEAAMNAQIRALTKGDVTKEAEVLALDTHRALTELNAQAREYKQLNSQLNKK
jgi:hypothetical protein